MTDVISLDKTDTLQAVAPTAEAVKEKVSSSGGGLGDVLSDVGSTVGDVAVVAVSPFNGFADLLGGVGDFLGTVADGAGEVFSGIGSLFD